MSRRHPRPARRIPPKKPAPPPTGSISIAVPECLGTGKEPAFASASINGMGTCPTCDLYTGVAELEGVARILPHPGLPPAPTVDPLAALLSRSSPLVAAQRPVLLFRHVVPGVTRVPEDCRDKEGDVIIDKLLRWFCPALTEAEAARLAACPEARHIQLLPRPIKAFIERWAYR